MPTDLVEYFRALTNERSVRAIALRSGVDQTTLNRQLNGTSTLTVETVVAICRAYRLDMAAVFVGAGFITEEEARRFSLRIRLADFTDQELTREMVRRLEAGEATAHLEEPIATEIVEDVLAEKRAERAVGRLEDANLPYVGRMTESDLPEGIAADKRPRKGDTPDSMSDV
jgi:transcriptional regulator with XRE-family HTH domain